jgi:hypothetical protein
LVPDFHSAVEPPREGDDVNAADRRAELSDALLFAVLAAPAPRPTTE